MKLKNYEWVFLLLIYLCLSTLVLHQAYLFGYHQGKKEQIYEIGEAQIRGIKTGFNACQEQF